MACAEFVRAAGPNLWFDGRRLFLNGINLAWISYGEDINSSAARGSGLSTYCGWEEAIQFVAANGGNSVRVWLFEDPNKAIAFEGDRIVGLRHGVVEMARTLLEVAASYDIFVVLTLFNGADAKSRDCKLFGNQETLEALNNVIIRPLASALREYNSLAMWEVVNEPEAILDMSLIVGTPLEAPTMVCPGHYDRPGWSKGCQLPLQTLLRFVNHVAATLHTEDPQHLVTLGAWHFCTSSNGPDGSVNLYSNERLREAGGMAGGTLDVYQVTDHRSRLSHASCPPTDPLDDLSPAAPAAPM